MKLTNAKIATLRQRTTHYTIFDSQQPRWLAAELNKCPRFDKTVQSAAFDNGVYVPNQHADAVIAIIEICDGSGMSIEEAYATLFPDDDPP